MTVIGGRNLSKKQVERLFKRNTREARQQAYRLGRCCPECGAGYAQIEDNGCQGSELAFVCTSCGWQWDAADIPY